MRDVSRRLENLRFGDSCIKRKQGRFTLICHIAEIKTGLGVLITWSGHELAEEGGLRNGSIVSWRYDHRSKDKP